ncbi:SDR family NAD(P)-dependent oxidoreductase [Labrys sp. KNU-23]|uniref:SDR family NAD(P)-dependent oxidoreductase n=1 Tax=Labrys sp. KNU-23 TaxID=2789216 RepID=UPI0011F045AF|nr:SDR family NAD(P)-dependent oxidoreductase [Labrys sp. KNU-23]QEN85055.1 SDR family NAD(P)-dependent oxidoreductase [Labrys sp. KNU-23]
MAQREDDRHDYVASHIFDWDDQRRFAVLTGDVNPLHMDADAARRTQAGAPVVHGMHVLIWALDTLFGLQAIPPVASVQAKFLKFVYVGQAVNLRITQKSDALLKFSIDCEGVPTTSVTVRFEQGERAPFPERDQLTVVPIASTPDEHDVASLAGLKGLLAGKPEAAAGFGELYPSLAAASSPQTVEALGLMSTLVGMVCPGLHSIFVEAAFDLQPDAAAKPGLNFAADAIDERFQMVPVRIAGPGMVGHVSAILRPRPVAPPTPGMAAGSVNPGEFSQQRALIIGGSRGIGAVCSLLLAAGGAKVTITYRRGRSEAEAVAASINAHWPDAAQAMQYDVDRPAADQLVDTQQPTHVYYLATPKIFQQSTNLFTRALFEQFVDVYVSGFLDVVSALEGTGAGASYMYPSSIAVEERPKGMTEYAMAKAAGEQLCRDLKRRWPKSRYTVPRLPRINTDQTATVPPVPAADPIATMLPLLRQCA